MKTARTKPTEDSLSFLFGAACLILIPLAIFPGTFEEFRASKALATALLCAPFALFLLWREPEPSCRGWRRFALLLAVLIPFQSLLFAEWERRLGAELAVITARMDPGDRGQRALHPAFAEWPNLESLAHLAALLLAFLAAFLWSCRARLQRRHLRVLALATTAVLAVGLVVQHTSALPFIPRSTATALASTLGNSNELAEWATPILLIAIFTRPAQAARTRALLFLSSSCLLLLSGSRGGILALFVGGLVGLWLTRPCGARPDSLWMRRERKAIFGAMALAAVLVLSLPAARERAFSAFDPAHPTNAIRLDLWGTALKAIEQNPLFGVGFHRVEAGLEPYRSAREQAEEWQRLGRHTVIESPHQEALWLLSAGGLPLGLFAIAGALWLLGRQAVAVRRGGVATDAAGAFAALAAILVFACIRSPFQHTSGMLVLGLALGQIEFFAQGGLELRAKAAASSPGRLMRHRFWLWAIGLTLALFFGLRIAPTAVSLLQCSAPKLAEFGDFLTLTGAIGLLLLPILLWNRRQKRPLLEGLVVAIAACLLIEDVQDDATIDRLRRTKREAIAEQARDPRALSGPTWAALGEQAKALASQPRDLGWRRASRLVPEVADLVSLRQSLEAAAEGAQGASPLRALCERFPTGGALVDLIKAVQLQGPVHVAGYWRWKRLAGDGPGRAKAEVNEWVKRSLARAPMTPELRVIAAELAMERDEAAAALKWLEAEARLFENPQASLRVEMGLAQLGLDKDPKAFRRLTEGSNPAAAEPWLARAMRSLADARPEKAQEEALIALSFDPMNAAAAELIAQAGYVVPEGADAARAKGTADQAAAYSRLAYAREAIQSKDFAQAERTLRLALRKMPDSLEGEWLSARIAAQRGQVTELKERLISLRSRGVARADLEFRAETEDPSGAIRAILAALE